MQPSCSQYAKIAFSRHTPTRAYLMTSDRLLRCGHDAGVDGQIDSSGRIQDTPDNDQEDYGPQAARGLVVMPQDSQWLGADSARVSFPRYLMYNRRFERAVDEYYRILFRQDSSANGMALKELSYCYLLSRDYSGFFQFYHQRLISGQIPSGSQGELDLLLAKARHLNGDFAGSNSILAGYKSEPPAELGPEMEFVRVLNFARSANWVAAKKHAEQIPLSSPRRSTADQCCSIGASLKPKSPAVAGSLGLVPGLGYLYIGKKGTALGSLIVNGLFAWTTWECIERKQYAIAGTATFLGTGWYIGNIWGSYNGAIRHNENFLRSTINNCLAGSQGEK